MHDTAHFERSGRPSAALLSDGFRPQAQYQASCLGLEKAHKLFVKHPISDQTKQQLFAKADAVYQYVVRALTSNEDPIEFDDQETEGDTVPALPQANGSAECST